ncbi:MAG: Asr1405/Asl0597 family protein [Cyanobacteria bacterium J06638_6]
MRIAESSNLRSSQASVDIDNHPLNTVFELDRADRWTVYRRLKDLNVVCECKCDRPLRAAIHTPTEALQVWSVLQAITRPKCLLADHLERCWQQRSL